MFVVGLRVSNSHLHLCLIKLSKIIGKEIIPVQQRKKVKLIYSLSHNCLEVRTRTWNVQVSIEIILKTERNDTL